MKFTYTTAIALTGFLWLGIGSLLISRGLGYAAAIHALHLKAPIVRIFFRWTQQHEQAILLAVCVGLALGFLKSKFIFTKTVDRVVKRIVSYEEPIKISQIYPLYYLFIILGMSALGALFRWLPIPQDFKMIITIAVGSALIQGAWFYFKKAFVFSKALPK